ncbi:MAG: pyridoxamine 5'-phosphate oxidase [Acidobacteria bacterium]|nr:pyridoxamine 5'-phosphate oxidase [Acidobacteriota bacterium]
MRATVNLESVRAKLATETGLVEVVTIRKSGKPLISVVNAGIILHPGGTHDVVAFVSLGNAVKLQHLRNRPEITLAVRRGWEWIAVDGTAELAGPNDPHPDVAPDAVPGLLRSIFLAAGGTHDDWDEFDRVMVDEQRCAVLITPDRVYPTS